MFCHGCGSFCPESWQFCSGCGTKVPSTSSDQEASARVAPTCSATSAIGNPSVAAPAPTRSAVGSVSFAAVPMPQVSESKPLSFEQFLKERKTTSSRFQLTKKKGKVVKAEKVKVSFHLTHYFYLQSVVGGGRGWAALSGQFLQRQFLHHKESVPFHVPQSDRKTRDRQCSMKRNRVKPKQFYC